MPTFTDAKGRKWDVSLNVTAVEDLKTRLGLDVGGKAFFEALSHPKTLADVLFVVCEDEAKARGVTDREFGRGLAGDAIQAGADAVYEALVLFTPSDRRSPLEAVAAKAKGVGQAATKLLVEKGTAAAEAFSAIPDEVLAAEMISILSARAGGSPASSASTPAPAPSAS